MKKMKLCCALLGAGILSSSSLFADITVNNPVIGGADGGGAFTATDNTPGGLGTFLTFCLELNEHITLPGTYNYTPSVGAINGGNGYAPTPGATATFDPISIGTAYLYYQFESGGFGAPTPTLGNAMQNAIWWLENEIPTLSVDGQALINFAQNQLGPVDLASNSDGAYGVLVMNLTSFDANGNLVLNQSLLASPETGQFGVVPEPSTVIAGALLLLPLGISALRIVRKNRTV